MKELIDSIMVEVMTNSRGNEPDTAAVATITILTVAVAQTDDPAGLVGAALEKIKANSDIMKLPFPPQMLTLATEAAKVSTTTQAAKIGDIFSIHKQARAALKANKETN